VSAPRPPGGGPQGARADAYRDLARELGDGWAELLCAWADLRPDPAEAVAALLSVLALRAPGQLAGDVAECFAQTVDWPAWCSVRRGLDERECPR
jgi:hypothetical protein